MGCLMKDRAGVTSVFAALFSVFARHSSFTKLLSALNCAPTSWDTKLEFC
jgi:hypothetical protein